MSQEGDGVLGSMLLVVGTGSLHTGSESQSKQWNAALVPVPGPHSLLRLVLTQFITDCKQCQGRQQQNALNDWELKMRPHWILLVGKA